MDIEENSTRTQTHNYAVPIWSQEISDQSLHSDRKIVAIRKAMAIAY